MNAMGRLNASTEIIPLQGPSGRNEARFRQNFRPKPKPYFVDPHIVPRVKQYLEDHKDTVHVDMDAMVDELQRKYKDYARRKRNAFKQSVDKAFKTVLQQYGVSGDYDGGDLENSESSDEEMYSEDVSLENSSNTQAAGQLMNMYMNRPGLRRGEAGGGDKELINISSDEEDGGGGGPKSRGGHAPSSSSVGLLPTPTLGPPPTPGAARQWRRHLLASSGQAGE
ncbi:Nuclear valosin-containing protein-like, partial [Gryllus bimaculatus]